MSLSRRELFRRTAEIAGVTAVAAIAQNFVAETASADDDLKNFRVGEAPQYTWFHPMTIDAKTGETKVWSYGIILRDPQLPGAALADAGEYGNITLTGAGTTGVDVTIGKELDQYKWNGAARAAIWGNAGKGDRVYLMDNQNLPATVFNADDKGNFGILLPETPGTQFGVRVERVTGAEAVRINFGSLSQEDAKKPLEKNVIDAVKFLQNPTTPAPAVRPAPVVLSPVETPAAPTVVAQPAEAPKPAATPVPVAEAPKTVDFLPAEQIMAWTDAEGKGFFRPTNWSKFVHYSLANAPRNTDGTPKFSFRDKGNVGEFFALVRGAKQVRLDIQSDINYANDARQGKDGAAFWLDNLPQGAVLRICDMNGKVLSEAKADNSGFGGIQLPTNKSEAYILLVDFVNDGTVADVRFQMGPATNADLAKPSTARLPQ